MLRRVELRNWRSIQSQALELGPVNIFIGPNAAGKSSVIDALRFLTDTVRSDLESALARRGGLENIRFRGAEPDAPVTISIECSAPGAGAPHNLLNVEYQISIALEGHRPVVVKEELRDRSQRDECDASKGLCFLSRSGKGLAFRDGRREGLEFDTGTSGVLALQALGFLLALPQIRALRGAIESWVFLNTDPSPLRQPQQSEDTVANVLWTLRMKGKEEKVERILENLRALLSHIGDVQTTLELSGFVMLRLVEQPFGTSFDVLALSDGTLRLLALLTALETMPEDSLLCVEEPECGLHPLILGPLLNIIREYCGNSTRQVLLTTHSPALINVARPDEVIVVVRNPAGASEFQRFSSRGFNRG